jgi:hypothetical protein
MFFAARLRRFKEMKTGHNCQYKHILSEIEVNHAQSPRETNAYADNDSDGDALSLKQGSVPAGRPPDSAIDSRRFRAQSDKRANGLP